MILTFSLIAKNASALYIHKDILQLFLSCNVGITKYT